MHASRARTPLILCGVFREILLFFPSQNDQEITSMPVSSCWFKHNYFPIGTIEINLIQGSFCVKVETSVLTLMSRRFTRCVLLHMSFGLKWNESGFRPPLWKQYTLNWARRTSSGSTNEWDDNAFQTQNSKVEPWRSEAEHATSRSRRLLAILKFCKWAGKKHLVSSKLGG